MTERTVLCVDGESEVDDVATAVGEVESVTAVTRTSAADAATVIETTALDCVVTEYGLADGTGLDVLRTLRTEQPQTPCVLFTDVRPREIDTASVGNLVTEYLSKDLPNATERLGGVVADVISHSAQVGFPLPEGEGDRLESLARYDLAELPVEASFDRLTDLVADHFETPIAFVGLIEEDAENILACHGAEWGRLTREETVCTHSMLQEDVLVVEDLQADERFAGNEGIQNLGVRSYAGANMTAPEGHVIGQLCVLDHEPRTYSADERRRLQQFAETAMEILDLRQSLREARELSA
ncbi:GAF domain-containing protein [Haloarcula marina]|uniref:GAF domain-containing protein n=1 Tax=Haloarcula marina TaxID=2961574 RepID=UPI0020B7C121|nr:GAF domain-containing protein [Halomicroarcula marina]